MSPMNDAVTRIGDTNIPRQLTGRNEEIDIFLSAFGETLRSRTTRLDSHRGKEISHGVLITRVGRTNVSGLAPTWLART